MFRFMRSIILFFLTFASFFYETYLVDDETVLTTGPSGFVWLRYLCAAIMNPKLFGITNENPHPDRYRDLTLIVKVLQNLGMS